MLAAVESLALQRVGPLEFLARPEFDRRQAQRQAVGGDGEAGVHEDAADSVHPLAASLVLVALGDLVRQADRLGVFAREGELGRVVQYEHRPFRRGKAITRRLKVPSQDFGFAHAVVVQEAVCRLGGGPVAARQGNRTANACRHLFHQRAKPLSKASVGELAPRQFLIDP